MSLNWANVDFLNAISDALWYREHCMDTTAPTGPDVIAAQRTTVGAGAGRYVKALGSRIVGLVGDQATSFGVWFDPAVSGHNSTTTIPIYTTAEWATIIGNGSGAGWTHRFFKEIASTAVTSATWADGSTLANGDVVRSRFDGRNYLRSGGAWVASSNAMPDIVTSYGFGGYLDGEIIGQWIFDEWRNALGAMTRKVITDQSGTDAVWDAGSSFVKGGTGAGSSSTSAAAAEAIAVSQANTNFAANTTHPTAVVPYAVTKSSVVPSYNATINPYDAASFTMSTSRGAWLTRTGTFLAKTGLYGPTFAPRTWDAQGVPAISPGVYRIWDTQTGSGTLTSVRLGLTGPPPNLNWANDYLGFQVDAGEVTLDFAFPALGF